MGSRGILGRNFDIKSTITDVLRLRLVGRFVLVGGVRRADNRQGNRLHWRSWEGRVGMSFGAAQNCQGLLGEIGIRTGNPRSGAPSPISAAANRSPEMPTFVSTHKVDFI